MEGVGNNRRQFFRIVLNIDMCASIMIHSAYGTSINSKKSYICIKDISGGGVKFRCLLDFPVSSDIVYIIEFSIENVDYSYKANIMRKSIENDGTYIYGAKFKIDEIERDKFITTLYNFTTTYKKTVNPTYVQCNKKRCPNKNKG